MKNPSINLFHKMSGVSDKIYLIFISVLTIGGTIYIYQDMSAISSGSDTATATPTIQAKSHQPSNKLAPVLAPVEVVKIAETKETAAAQSVDAPKAKTTLAKSSTTDTSTVAADSVKAPEPVTPAPVTKVQEVAKTADTKTTEPAPQSQATAEQANKTEKQPTSVTNKSEQAIAQKHQITPSEETGQQTTPASVTTTDANNMFAPAQQMADMITMPTAVENDMQQHYTQMHRNMPEPIRQEMPQQIQQNHYQAAPYHYQNNRVHQQVRDMPMPTMYDDMSRNAQEMHQHMQQYDYDRRAPAPQRMPQQMRNPMPNYEPQVHYQNEMPGYGRPPMPQMPWQAPTGYPYQQ